MIFLDGKMISTKVRSYNYNSSKNVYYIQYNNNYKFYPYEAKRIKILDDFNKVDLSKNLFYLNGVILNDIKDVYENTRYRIKYYQVVFSNHWDEYDSTQLKKVPNNTSVINYMKKISEIISLSTETGKKLLCEQMKKVNIDSLDSALSNYLKMNTEIKRNDNINDLIFPFGCNSSQYIAVENAINNKISVIEGPPGTGKTQTILNIIANIIIRNMNCQVVSNNNTAIENIEEKLTKYNLEFITALLGKASNKEIFIQNQKIEIPSFTEYENIEIKDIKEKLDNNREIVKRIYNSKQFIATMVQRKNELLLEYDHFKDNLKFQTKKILDIKRINYKKLHVIWNELLNLEEISFLNKMKYVFIYRIATFEFYNNDIEIIINSIQNELYKNEIKVLEEKINNEKHFVEENKNIEQEFISLSMDYLKKSLSIKYKNKRKVYTKNEISKNYNLFLKDYPVILSTTYSSRNTFDDNMKFDYIIMDEASQIDVVTGTLALSSSKYAVVIGDEKQLPNVIPNDIAIKANQIFKEYNIDENYNYSINSFLSSIKKTVIDVPKVILKEHYRCHPKIINFCNKKFYNNELIIMTEDMNEEDVIKVIKTNKGNHSREKTNQRQIDIIKDELVNQDTIDIGIIAPYNNQVNLIKKDIKNIEVSTVHKFQGREKDVIIISTVDDNISDFVGNPNILNVAISRAKKKLVFIVTGNEITNTNILDFIEYTKYINMDVEESKISSVFDLLYKQYENERIEYFKKHKRVSKFDSENIIYNLLKDIIAEYENLDFMFIQPMNTLIKDKSLLTDEEKRYASNNNTHIDFLIYNEISKKPVLAIEVDGYKYHKEGTQQYERDKLKRNILSKYNIPLLRLKTNSSGEKDRIKHKLNTINKIRILKGKSGKIE